MSVERSWGRCSRCAFESVAACWASLLCDPQLSTASSVQQRRRSSCRCVVCSVEASRAVGDRAESPGSCSFRRRATGTTLGTPTGTRYFRFDRFAHSRISISRYLQRKRMRCLHLFYRFKHFKLRPDGRMYA